MLAADAVLIRQASTRLGAAGVRHAGSLRWSLPPDHRNHSGTTGPATGAVTPRIARTVPALDLGQRLLVNPSASATGRPGSRRRCARRCRRVRRPGRPGVSGRRSSVTLPTPSSGGLKPWPDSSSKTSSALRSAVVASSPARPPPTRRRSAPHFAWWPVGWAPARSSRAGAADPAPSGGSPHRTARAEPRRYGAGSSTDRPSLRGRVGGRQPPKRAPLMTFTGARPSAMSWAADHCPFRVQVKFGARRADERVEPVRPLRRPHAHVLSEALPCVLLLRASSLSWS
jgi:hypothetical protein